MAKKGGSAPSPPDPVATAGAQTSMNIGTGIAQQALNTTNQVTPYGTLNYNQTGMRNWKDPLTGKTYDLPQFTATQKLSPEQQQLYNQQTRASTGTAKLAADQTARLGSILGKPVNTSGAPTIDRRSFTAVGAAPTLQSSLGAAGPITSKIASAGNVTGSYGDAAGYAGQRQRVEDALMARMNPSLEQERSRLSAQLANQGIKQGTEAFDRAQANYGQRANDARYGAILAGGEEQSRLAGLDRDRATFQNDAQSQRFGQNATQAAFGNAAQQQGFDQNVTRGTFRNDALQQGFNNQIAGTGFNNQVQQQAMDRDQGMRSAYLNEQYAARNQPINEIAALLGTGQVQNPNFVNTPQSGVANTDYAGLVNANYNQKLQAWQQKQQQQQGMLGGLLGLGASGITAFSDRRLKTDVSFLGMLRDLPVYAYRYIWGGPMQIGVMAQDMLTLRPEAVFEAGGFLAVDYGAL